MAQDFRTIVQPASEADRRRLIWHGRPMLAIGSCFADAVGQGLLEMGMDIRVNPLGPLYNPLSIADALEGVAPMEPLKRPDGRWCTLSAHSRVSCGDPDKFRAMLEDARQAIRRFMDSPDDRLLLVTWGTATAFRLRSTGQVVANCHKMPAALFSHALLSVDDIASRWSSILEGRPGLQVLLTVSPVRHLCPDGSHANTLSKAALHLAGDALARRFPDRVTYFPAYELLTDDLRDYRFYDAQTMVHPTPQAASYVLDALMDWHAETSTRQLAAQVQKLRRRLGHRPLTDDPAALQEDLQARRRAAETLHGLLPANCRHAIPPVDAR